MELVDSTCCFREWHRSIWLVKIQRSDLDSVQGCHGFLYEFLETRSGVITRIDRIDSANNPAVRNGQPGLPQSSTKTELCIHKDALQI